MTHPNPPQPPRSEVMIAASGTASTTDMMTVRMREHMGPFGADSSARQLIMTCWRALPEERRNLEETERQVRRLVERALIEFREDGDAFGFS